MPRSTLSLFAVCVLIWGSTWLAITYQLGVVAPEYSVGYRFLLASLVLGLFCRWRGHALKFDRSQHVAMLWMGAGMFCVSYIFVYHAELHIISGMVAVGYSASPLINMLFARLLFATPVKPRVVLAGVLGVVGIVCVFWHEFARLGESRSMGLGALFTMLSVLFSCLGNMAAMRVQKRGIATWPSLVWGMFYGGCLSILIGLASGHPLQIELTLTYLSSMVYLALLGSIVTFAAFLTLLKRVGAARAAYVGVMVPVIALIISAVFETFAWGWLTTLGVATLLVGNVLMLRGGNAAPA